MQHSGGSGRARPPGWLLKAGVIGAVSLGAAVVSRGRKLRRVAPGLRSFGLAAVPPMLPVLVPLMQYATRRVRPSVPPGIHVSELLVPSSGNNAPVRVLRFEREDRRAGGPAMVWLHGGGYLIGTPEIDMALLARVLSGIDVTVFSVDYRLAPKHPFPAPLDDAVDVLRWLVDNAATLGLDPARIAVGGNSAGGGLAAALAQWACDQRIDLALQLLMYPMLDDRTVVRANNEGRGELVWTPANNRLGWQSYLGRSPGAAEAPAYAVPARRERLSGLAPAWIGVGALDLFHDEDIAYAKRLRAAEVPCTLDVVPAAPHAFDLFNFDAPVTLAFHAGMIAALTASFAPRADAGQPSELAGSTVS